MWPLSCIKQLCFYDVFRHIDLTIIDLALKETDNIHVLGIISEQDTHEGVLVRLQSYKTNDHPKQRELLILKELYHSIFMLCF